MASGISRTCLPVVPSFINSWTDNQFGREWPIISCFFPPILQRRRRKEIIIQSESKWLLAASGSYRFERGRSTMRCCHARALPLKGIIWLCSYDYTPLWGAFRDPFSQGGQCLVFCAKWICCGVADSPSPTPLIKNPRSVFSSVIIASVDHLAVWA